MAASAEPVAGRFSPVQDRHAPSIRSVPSNAQPLQSRVVTRSAAVLALVFVLIGGAALWVSGLDAIKENMPLSGFLSQLGGLLLATGLITIAWDLFGRRAFADEVLAKAKLSTDVVDSGLIRVTDQYLDEVEWVDPFQDVNKLDIVVAYAYTWRNAHRARLQAAARRGCRIRVFLPDYRDDETINILAGRFSMPADALKAKIQEAVADFKALPTPTNAPVQVCLRTGDLVFSCYRFDSRAVLTLYSHSRERRTNVPTFVTKNGSLFTYVYDELEAIAQQSQPAL